MQQDMSVHCWLVLFCILMTSSALNTETTPCLLPLFHCLENLLSLCSAESKCHHHAIASAHSCPVALSATHHLVTLPALSASSKLSATLLQHGLIHAD
jgi:hypothetical protein